MISTLEQERDITNRSQRDLYVQGLCKREKNPRIAKTLEILFGEEATMKCCQNLHVTTSLKLEETSEDHQETKSFFFLSFILFLFIFYPCMHIRVSIILVNTISIKSLHHLHDNHSSNILNQPTRKRGLKEKDSSRLVHSIFYYFEIILNKCYTNKN